MVLVYPISCFFGITATLFAQRTRLACSVLSSVDDTSTLGVSDISRQACTMYCTLHNTHSRTYAGRTTYTPAALAWDPECVCNAARHQISNKMSLLIHFNRTDCADIAPVRITEHTCSPVHTEPEQIAHAYTTTRRHRTAHTRIEQINNNNKTATRRTLAIRQQKTKPCLDVGSRYYILWLLLDTIHRRNSPEPNVYFCRHFAPSLSLYLYSCNLTCCRLLWWLSENEYAYLEQRCQKMNDCQLFFVEKVYGPKPRFYCP